MPSFLVKQAAVPFAALAVFATTAARAQDVLAVTRRASPAVVTLHTFNAAGRETGLGSGFFLPDGRIATNRHVVEGSARIDVVAANDRTLGSVQYAEAIGGQPDLAILPRIGAPPATLTLASRLPEAGEGVVVIGAPEGLSNTVSNGIVSAIRNLEGTTLIQISAPISHGSSGGPVLNMRGEVIGVSVSLLSEGQNLNFAVPSTDLLALTRAPAGHLAFSGPRGGSGDASAGPDYERLNRAQLPRIAAGQAVSDRLTRADFRRSDGSFAKVYVYNGRAGEQIDVALRSTDFDSWLEVDDPNGPFYQTDDDSGGGLNSEVTATLPHTGEYLIVANSVGPGATGAYSLSIRGAGGGQSGNATGGSDGSGGGGTLEQLAQTRLPAIAAGQTVRGQLTRSSFLRSDDQTYANGYRYTGHAGERITITMRSADVDSWLVVDDPNGPLRVSDDDSGGGNDAQLTVTLPHDGAYLIVANAVSPGATGSYTLSVQRGGTDGGGGGGGGRVIAPIGRGGSGTVSDLATAPNLRTIAAGQTVRGTLTTSSFRRSEDQTYADGYLYTGRAGERITVTLRSADFDSWLVVDDPNGPLRETDDDSGGGNDAQLSVTLPHDGTYLIVANTVSAGSTGSYTLTVQSTAARTIQPLH